MHSPSHSSHQSQQSRHHAAETRSPANTPTDASNDSPQSAVSPSTPALVTPSHTLLLYTRPIHPELVQMKARKTMQLRGLGTGPSRQAGAAEFEAWLTPLGHMLRYQTKTHCFCELVTDKQSGLPTTCIAFSVPAVGEKDHEQLFAEPCVLYTTSIQTETLPAPIYNSNYREMVELAEEVDALLHTWTIPGHTPHAKCLSMLELQRFDDEMHAQSTHMCPIQGGGGLVLRTQTVFQRV